LNLPLRAATPAADQKRAFESALDDMASSFSPDLIIISAGFDSHVGDPLGQLMLKDEDFVALTRAVKEWAASSCQGRLVSCLEGGYNLETLGETVRAHVEELSRG
jgi:acetoin utilization deacetylase AcuC-like enzyme